MMLVCCIHCGELLDEALGEECDCTLDPCVLTEAEKIELATGCDETGAPSQSSRFAEVVRIAAELSIETGRDLASCLRAASTAVRSEPS